MEQGTQRDELTWASATAGSSQTAKSTALRDPVRRKQLNDDRFSLPASVCNGSANRSPNLDLKCSIFWNNIVLLEF